MAKRDDDEPDRPRERRDREADVIEAAITIFHRKGFGAASVQDVANEVGVLKGSLYYYIESKEDLLFRVFMESHRQSAAILEETKALEVSAVERLRAYFERYVLWYLENVERVSIYFSEWRHLTGERHAAVLEQRRRYNEFVAGLIDDVKQELNGAVEVDTKFATFFILGAVNGLPSWYHRDRGTDPRIIASAYTDMIMSVVCPVPSLELGGSTT